MTTEAEQQEAIEKIANITKKGFDLSARLQNRGLRKATITLYLDEELGAELGDAYDVKNAMGITTGRERTGIIGDLDALIAARDTPNPDGTAGPDLADSIASLEAKRDALIEELAKTGIVVSLRAVPPVIEEDCKRKARETLGLKEKGIPKDLSEEFTLAQTAHLMSVMIQRVTDNATGEVNEGATYDDCVSMMEYLPKSQFARLDQKLGELQFTDAISRSIEGQEDFS